MKKKKLSLKILLPFLCFIPLIFVLWSEAILQLPALLITKRSPLQEKGQIGIVLMGSFSKRSQQMAKLYNEGWVEKIVYAEAESSYYT